MLDHNSLYAKYLDEITNKWLACPDHFPSEKKKFSSIEKFLWEMKCDRFLRFIKSQKESNKSELLIDKCRSFFKEELAYTGDQLELIFSDEMVDATKDFMNRALLFDSNLDNEEIFQALRNQWIVFGLQALFELPIQTTPSTLAYSLLYPYSDNYIDHPMISEYDKIEFSDRFAKRLQGENVIASNENEQKIFDLVAMIESEYEREKFPKVYESLLDIHQAQTRSIALTSSKQILSDLECFEIAVTKGATSVIADGYLIAGNLDENQHRFLYEYGAYLQILDDLQDAKDDLYEGVFTCFSKNLTSQYLDQMLCKTYHLGKEVLSTLASIYPNKFAYQGLIKRSFSLLFASSVVLNPKDYSDEFIQKCEQHSPFRFSYAEKHMNEMKNFDILMNQKLNEYKEGVGKQVIS